VACAVSDEMEIIDLGPWGQYVGLLQKEL